MSKRAPWAFLIKENFSNTSGATDSPSSCYSHLDFLAKSLLFVSFLGVFFNEDVYGVSGDVNLITSDLFLFQSCLSFTLFDASLFPSLERMKAVFILHSIADPDCGFTSYTIDNYNFLEP